MAKTKAELMSGAESMADQVLELMARLEKLEAIPPKVVEVARAGAASGNMVTPAPAPAPTRQHEKGCHLGLCTDPGCTPCRTAANGLVKATTAKARNDLFGELNRAAVWAGKPAAGEELIIAFEAWEEAGRPEAAKDGAVPVEAAAATSEVLEGLGV